LYLAII